MGYQGCGPKPDDAYPNWYRISVGDEDCDRIIVTTLTDRGIGDYDLTANSAIVDDSSPSLPKTYKGNPGGRWQRHPARTPASGTVGLQVISHPHNHQ